MHVFLAILHTEVAIVITGVPHSPGHARHKHDHHTYWTWDSRGIDHIAHRHCRRDYSTSEMHVILAAIRVYIAVVITDELRGHGYIRHRCGRPNYSTSETHVVLVALHIQSSQLPSHDHSTHSHGHRSYSSPENHIVLTILHTDMIIVITLHKIISQFWSHCTQT